MIKVSGSKYEHRGIGFDCLLRHRFPLYLIKMDKDVESQVFHHGLEVLRNNQYKLLILLHFKQQIKEFIDSLQGLRGSFEVIDKIDLYQYNNVIIFRLKGCRI